MINPAGVSRRHRHAQLRVVVESCSGRDLILCPMGDLHVSHTATARRFLAEGEPVDAVGEQPEDQVSAATSPAAVALTVAAQL